MRDLKVVEEERAGRGAGCLSLLIRHQVGFQLRGSRYQGNAAPGRRATAEPLSAARSTRFACALSSPVTCPTS